MSSNASRSPLPTKPKRVIKMKEAKTTVVETVPITEVVATVEEEKPVPPSPPVEEMCAEMLDGLSSDDEKSVKTAETGTDPIDAPDWEAKYKAMKALYQEAMDKIKALEDARKQPKNSNSPDIEDGVHIRMLDGVKTKMRYVYPYSADGGKSLVKDMKEGQTCYGVSTTQPNNSKNTCKTADYKMMWVNKNVVRDRASNKAFAQKDGKFAIVDEVSGTATNVRLMVLA